jgi:hypothetical protein
MPDQFVELREALAVVSRMTDERIVQFPKYPPYRHVRDQISYVEGFAATKRIPTRAEKDVIDMGIMALKKFDSDDPEYAQWLMKLNDRFERLTRSGRWETTRWKCNRRQFRSNPKCKGLAEPRLRQARTSLPVSYEEELHCAPGTCAAFR